MLWNNDKLVERYYFTFKEALKLNTYFKIYVDKVATAYGVPMGLTEIIATMIPNTEVSGTISFDDTTTRKLFTEYLWPEFQNATIAYIDKERSLWEAGTAPNLTDMMGWFIQHGPLWLRWLRESKERYVPLITNLEAIQSKLMDRIGSQSVTLFNDTPQNGGNFVADPYTTNATKSTTESDVATPIARLKEVQDLLRNYYADWANEFSRFIIKSAEGLE